MKVISSQRYTDWNIVNEKINQMEEDETKVLTLPVIDSGMTNEDGEELYILIDGHHRKEAAEELGIKVEYEEVENEYNCTGEDLLKSNYMDSDWYYVENGAYVW